MDEKDLWAEEVARRVEVRGTRAGIEMGEAERSVSAKLAGAGRLVEDAFEGGISLDSLLVAIRERSDGCAGSQERKV